MQYGPACGAVWCSMVHSLVQYSGVQYGAVRCVQYAPMHHQVYRRKEVRPFSVPQAYVHSIRARICAYVRKCVRVCAYMDISPRVYTYA